jgi:hypothetical protein
MKKENGRSQCSNFRIWKNNDSQTSIKPKDLNLEFYSSFPRIKGEEANGKDYYSFQLKNSNNTSRMTTFWNGKKFTETISTEL